MGVLITTILNRWRNISTTTYIYIYLLWDYEWVEELALRKDKFPYNMKVKTEWDAGNKEWNILAVEDRLECESIKCKECKWYDYCEWYQIKIED